MQIVDAAVFLLVLILRNLFVAWNAAHWIVGVVRMGFKVEYLSRKCFLCNAMNFPHTRSPVINWPRPSARRLSSTYIQPSGQLAKRGTFNALPILLFSIGRLIKPFFLCFKPRQSAQRANRSLGIDGCSLGLFHARRYLS